MKRRMRFIGKLGVVVIAGAFLISVPFTAMADKTDSSEEIEIESTTEEESTEAEVIIDNKTENESRGLVSGSKDMVSKSSTAVKEETTESIEKTDAAVSESQTQTDAKSDLLKESVPESGENMLYEEDNAANPEADNKTADETTDIVKESESIEETENVKPTETFTEKENDADIAEKIIGSWDLDGYTGFKFDSDNNGKLIAGENTYIFKYTITDNMLKLNFESSKASDCTYIVSISDDVLHLEGEEGSIGGTFELAKAIGNT